jgi:hypothetical protein
MERAEHKVARLCRSDGQRDCLKVAHLAYEYDIRVFSQGGSQRAVEGFRVIADFALVNQRLLVGVYELYRVFNGDDVR